MSTGLSISFSDGAHLEAGIDEAGRGCLAGPVFAAAVILSSDISYELSEFLNDSKKLSAKTRARLRRTIESQAMDYGVAYVDNQEIDRINILNASFHAMHRAISKLKIVPELLLVDGNRFKPYHALSHECIVKGDAKYYSIAAASVLAKTYRDEFMEKAHLEFPHYNWLSNKGYPTAFHRSGIMKYGLSPLHRRSFNCGFQMKMDL
jgi:ribonuclease HII